MTINAHTLVRRQTPQSAFSHFTMFDRGTPERRFRLLCALIEGAIGRCDYVASPALDAIVVNLPPSGDNMWAFLTPIVSVTDLDPTVEFSTYMTTRAEGEESYLCTHANIWGPMSEVKSTAKACQAILYLAENQLEPRDAMHAAARFHSHDWDLVSLNASPTVEPTPQHPESMARNQLGMVGGSDATYTPDQWAKSVHYWGSHVRLRCAGRPSLLDVQWWGDTP